MRKRRKIIRKRRRRRFLFRLVILALIVAVFSGKIRNFNPFHKDTANAVNVTKGLELIKEKDLIKNEIDKRNREKKLKEVEARIIEEEKIKAEESSKNNASKKIAYLTFDDGPSVKSTPIILDVLKKHDIKATFFVVGYMVEENPDILKRVYDEGHKIGNHSYSHQYEYIYKNVDNFMKDLYRAENLIKSIVGEDFDSKVMRFPGGSFEDKKNPMKKAVLDAGYKYFDWNALNGDAEGNSFSEEHLVNRLKETVSGKSKVIILMHDTDAKITTAKSLDKSIQYLLSEGYEFDVLDRNFNWE